MGNEHKPKWVSPIYFNVQPGLWQGIEITMTEVTGTETGIFGNLFYYFGYGSKQKKWLEFDSWYAVL